MIAPGAGVRVHLACGPTDMRKGIAGLAALAQEVLRQDPCSGAVFAFRGRRGDRVSLCTLSFRIWAVSIFDCQLHQVLALVGVQRFPAVLFGRRRYREHRPGFSRVPST